MAFDSFPIQLLLTVSVFTVAVLMFRYVWRFDNTWLGRAAFFCQLVAVGIWIPAALMPSPNVVRDLGITSADAELYVFAALAFTCIAGAIADIVRWARGPSREVPPPFG